MHLALSGLARLQRPEADARRLFFADLLFDAAAADQLAKAASEPGALAKYSPDQPRVAAGNGRISGRWTNAGDSGGTSQGAEQKRPPHRAPQAARRPSAAGTRTSDKTRSGPGPHRANTPTRLGGAAPRRPSAAPTSLAGAAVAVGVRGFGIDLAALSRAALGPLAEFVAGLAPATAVGAAAAAVGGFGLALIPMDITTGRWVGVAGPGNISVFRSPTVRGVGFRYTTADGVREDITVEPGPDGEFRNPKDGRVFARLVRSGTMLKLLISTATLIRSKDPQLCPEPRKESHGTRGQQYEDYVKAWFNPKNPTPTGFGYAFWKLRTSYPVTFDDCQKQTGFLAEFKGPGFEKHLVKNDPVWWGQQSGMILQAQDQVEASQLAGNRPIYWFFAEKSVADHMAGIFKHISPLIHVIWFPEPK
jgi:hypothetical protein